MKKRYLSVAVAVVLGNSTLMAESLEKAFKAGSLEGNAGAYAQQIDHKGASKEGFSNGFASIAFETAPLGSISFGLGAWGSAELSEENDGDYDGVITDKGIIHKAYIKVEHEGMVNVIVGRQEVDFKWMTDFIEGATVELSFIENLVINMAWAKRNAIVGFDEVIEFTKMNKNKGVYAVEAKYTPLEWLELNPFYYHAQNLFNAPGMKVTLSFEPQEELKTTTLLAYTKGSSDVSGTLDGYVAQIEQGVEFIGITAALGYIKTNEDGTGGLEAFGDQMPFEEGNYILASDAKTPYISVSYEIEALGGLALGAMYSETSYVDNGAKFKEKELSLLASYEIIDNLEASLIYVDVKNNDVTKDTYNAIKARLEYTF